MAHATDAYAIELDEIRTRIAQLRQGHADLVGDGMLDRPINWAQVGDLKRLKVALDAALEAMPRLP